MSLILRIFIVALLSALLSTGFAYLIKLIQKKIPFPVSISWFFIVSIPMISTLLIGMLLFESYSSVAFIPNIFIIFFITRQIIET